MPAAVATANGSEGNQRLGNKDGMVGVEGVVASFWFPFFLSM